jgi:hypothetical protein
MTGRLNIFKKKYRFHLETKPNPDVMSDQWDTVEKYPNIVAKVWVL